MTIILTPLADSGAKRVYNLECDIHIPQHLGL